MNRKYVVGLCGAHSTGKSWIMRAVEEKGFPVDKTPSLSRTAQIALGWDNLYRAADSVENFWALQDAILDAMQARDAAINKSGVYTLADRTPADVWAYVQMWIRKFGEANVDMNRAELYRLRCQRLAEQYRRQLYVPIHPQIAFVPEPGRANAESREQHSIDVRNFLGNYPFSEIRSYDINARADEAIWWLHDHNTEE